MMKRMIFLLMITLTLCGCSAWQITSESNAINPLPVLISPSSPADTSVLEPPETAVALDELATRAMLVPEESVPADIAGVPTDIISTDDIVTSPPASGSASEESAKTITMELEGNAEEVSVTLHEGGFSNGPSFGIYIDDARYLYSEAAGIYMLAPVDDPDGEVAALMLEFISGKDAATIADELISGGYIDGGIVDMESMGSAHYLNGVVDGQSSGIYLVNAAAGTFRASIYTIPEASEGHGARLYYLLRTLYLN